LFSVIQVSNTFSGSFLDVKDKIYMSYIGDNSVGIAQNQFINIGKYSVWNFSTTNQFKKDNWSFSLGGALIGVSQRIANQILVSNEKYLYSLNLNCSASYEIPKWQTAFSAYYKYNGRTQEFSEDKSGYYITTTGESNWLDASVRKTFFKNKLETTIGARNIFNITNINRAGGNNATAHAAPTQTMLAYGRSYFLKLTYNLNF
jgi:outer membrane receptor for ferrienterochelin and colicins